MSEQPNSEDKAEDAAPDAPLPPPVRVQIESAPKLEVAIQREPESDDELQRTHGTRKPWTRFEKWSLVVAAAVLVVTCVSILIYAYQLTEMRKATEASILSARAAEMAAKVAEGQLEQMRGGTEQTDRIIAEAARISSSLEESLKQSKAALDASIEAIRTDQRAWCSVPDIKTDGPKEISNLTDTAFDIFIKNSGRTPAINVRTGAGIVFSLDFPLPADFALPPIRPVEASVNTLGSQESQKTTVFLRAKTLNEWLAGHVKDKAIPIYFYIVGTIEYEDVFGKAHRTTFCRYARCANEQPGVLSIAPTWNHMD